MTTRARALYAGHRFPAEIIGHAVWLYFRFPLGLRMVEELLAARGIIVTHAAPGRERTEGFHPLGATVGGPIFLSGPATENARFPSFGCRPSKVPMQRRGL